MEIEQNIPLAPLTTFGIGGPAGFFARARSFEELHEALAKAKEHNWPVLILGGGSNLLVGDRGFAGLVIKIEIKGVEWKEEGEKTLLIAGAGEEWDSVVEQAVGKNLWGIENLSGIPGTVGAAPVQNIGAYGSELKDTLLWVEALDMADGEVKKFSNSDCAFSYRMSRFKKEPDRFVVLRVALALSAEPHAIVSYRDLAQAFAEKEKPSLPQIREAVLEIRAGKFPDLKKEGTAGSFFLNPIVSKELAAALAERYPELPQFEAQGGVKLPLAWLLDKALGLRGMRVGGARLFEKQPLVVVAQKNSSAEDVKKLFEAVRSEVKEKLGIEIEKEVRIL